MTREPEDVERAEFEALQKVIESLRDFDIETRVRILSAAATFLGVKNL
jgi:hypothetical protein